jgi:hypothetical protein
LSLPILRLTYPNGLTNTMRATITWAAAAALLASSVSGLDLKAEHAGGMFNRIHGGRGRSCPDDDGVINNGTAAGETVSLGNGMLSLPSSVT